VSRRSIQRVFQFAGQSTDRLNLWLSAWRVRFDRDLPEFVTTMSLRHDSEVVAGESKDPDLLLDYLNGVSAAWFIPLPVFILLMVALAYLGDVLAGVQGRHIGTAIGAFPCVVCVVGGLDAAWRLPFARQASRRFAASQTLDPQSRRLIAIARLNDATVVLQFLIAAGVAVVVAMS
jgi:hypothetical protein